MYNTNSQTYIINLIGGPGIGKTTIAALLFAKLKMMGESVEFAQEYAKTLVWTKKFDKLNDQYNVSFKQYSLIKSMSGLVRFIITDGCILNGIYYGQENKNNCSDIEKTNKKILEWFGQFNNINIVLTRGDFEYETAGRYHSEQEAVKIDHELKKILRTNNIQFTEIESDSSNVDKIIDIIKL